MQDRTHGMRSSRGQSLVETAIMLPLMLFLVLNAVNFGYFFLMMVNLTGASRSAATYSIEGSATPAATPLPPSGSSTNNLAGTLSVSYLAYQDMTGAIGSPTGASVQVCSPININGSNSGVNGTGANLKSNCVTCTGNTCGSVGTGSPVPSADPEAPSFVLNRVDILYTFTPIIPGTPFNIALLASPACTVGGGGSVTCTFRRTAQMRAM